MGTEIKGGDRHNRWGQTYDQISNPSGGGGGGWVGGLQVHNHATSWPNLQVRTCKNSIHIEFQVGPDCGKKSYRQTNE